MSKKIVRHISSQCCYYTEEDGKTVKICGCDLTPTIDGIIWEYVDKYIEKKPVPVNLYHKETKYILTESQLSELLRAQKASDWGVKTLDEALALFPKYKEG